MRSLNAKFLSRFIVTGIILVLLSVYLLWANLRTQQFNTIFADRISQLKQVDFAISSLLLDVEYDIENLLIADIVRQPNSEDFTNFLNADENTFTYNYSEAELAIIDIFNTLRLSHPYINSVYMGREDGSFVRSHPRGRPTQYDPRERPWYQLAINNPAKILRTEPYASLTTSDVNIGTVGALLDDNGVPYGVVGIDITLAGLTDYVSEIDVGAGGSILLLNETGIILTGADEAVLQNYEEAGLSFLQEAMVNSNGHITFEQTGSDYYLFYYTSPTLGWKIGASIPVEQINSTVNNIVNGVVAIFAISGVLLSVLAIINVQQLIVRPLNNLEQQTKQIEQTNDLSYRIVTSSNDEIGELATAFNAMLVTIQNSSEKLKRTQAIQNLIMMISTHLINIPADSYDTVIYETLAQVGDFSNVDRVRLVSYSTELTNIKNTHHWSQSNESERCEEVIDVSTETGAWLQSALKLHTPIPVCQLSDLPEQASELKSKWQNLEIKSILIIPFSVTENEVETIELVSTNREIDWADDTITMLKLLCPVFYNLLERRNSDEILNLQNQELTDYREHLEDIVEQRTLELQQINDQLATEVKAREQVAKTLEEREKQYRDLFEHASESIIIVDKSLRIVAANNNAARRLGYSIDELLDLHQNDIVADFDNDEKPVIRKSVTGTSLVYEAKHKRKDGSIVPVEVSSNLIQYNGVPAFQWFTRDITERKQAEQALKRANAELVVLFDLGQELLHTLKLDTLLPTAAQKISETLDADRCSVFLYNPRNSRLEVLTSHGYLSSRLNHFSYQPDEEPVGKSFTTGEVIYVPDVFAVPDLPRRDEIRTLLTVPLKSASGVIGVLSVTSLQPNYFSSNERRLVETMASLITSAVERARLFEAAQESDRLKSAFLATMSHELRTPLNSIIGFTGILLQGLVGPLNDEQNKQMKMVRDSARHLLALINDVLDISKIESGQLEVEYDEFDMRQVITEAIQTVKPMAEKKNIVLIEDVSPEVGQITSDHRRVGQILINLINNAVKFTEEGSVKVECSIANAWVVIHVIDTGIGIKSEDLDKLFKPFVQVDSGITRKREGTGLGLSICKRLADILGGNILVESEWESGSKFTVKLPINQNEKE